MPLSSNDLVEEFYNQEKEKYDLSLEEFKLICSSPFKLVKEVMASGILRNIRLQFLGVFEVLGRRVHYSLKNLEKNFEEGKITEKKYLERKQVYNNYEEV